MPDLREGRASLGAVGRVPVCASATALPLDAGTFDGALCFGLLHHLERGDAHPAFAEMRRVLLSLIHI